MPNRDDHRESKKRRSEDREHDGDRHKRSKEAQPSHQDVPAYTDLDNPFNDVNLGQQFKWQKKIDKEKKSGRSSSSRKLDAQRKREAQEELEQLGRRRLEREKEMMLREEEEARMSRLAESAQMADWLAKEHQFNLDQERNRATIRIREKRAKAVDFLCFNLRYIDPSADDGNGWSSTDVGDLEIDLEEPYTIFENLSYQQTQELHDDIQKFLSLESEQVNVDFWTNMMVICQDRLDRMKLTASRTFEKSSVDHDIDRLLAGKTLDQLSLLQKQVQEKLSGDEAVDVEYWENLIKTIFVAKAKAKLSSLHEVIVRNRLEQLRRLQRDEVEVKQSSMKNSVLPVLPASGSPEKPRAIPYKRDMSPSLIPFSKIPLEDRSLDVIDEVGDRKKLMDSRRTVEESRRAPKSNAQDVSGTSNQLDFAETYDADSMWRAEADIALEEEEEYFNTEATVSHPTTYTWGDKYRPRKPKYFNRVHTGYEWNKYNQTHYDTDNPPPKVVQGYKFNIFYPDLIDKSKAPTYKLVQEPGSPDTVLLYFTAGPPYEDIAFRIVDREWEFSHKRGFRCSFDRGCLSLWFNFKRSFYRK